MIVAWFFLFIGLFSIAYVLFDKFLPNFVKQDLYTQRAKRIAWELSGSKATSSGFYRFVAEKLIPGVKKITGIENLLGARMRNMVEVLGEYASVEEMLAKKLVRSVMFALPALVLLVVDPILVVAFPVGIIFLYIRDIKDVKNSFEKMQREIIKDLPMLIDKIMIALETGKPFIQVFKEVEQSSGPKMKHLLGRLNANMQYMNPSEALEIFAKETTIPVMMQFSTSVKIGIEQGYESAIGYFEDIKTEIKQLRRVSIEEITKGKPEEAQIYTMLMIVVALGSVAIVGYHILSQFAQIM